MALFAWKCELLEQIAFSAFKSVKEVLKKKQAPSQRRRRRRKEK
jgi:hypothetical protein